MRAEGEVLVSVVIPFLNPGRFFGEAIKSAVEQTRTEWELLLVNDGSTDGSELVAEEWVRRCPGRIRMLSHPGGGNRGSSAARNVGIARARGELIAFLDADDVWLPRKLEKQVALLNENPEAAMVYGSTRMWYSWKPENKVPDRQRALGVKTNRMVAPPEMAIRFLRRKAETPGISSALIRRSAIEAIGGFEEGFRDMFDDQVFFAKIVLRFPVFVESGVWDWYRQHEGSCCHRSQRAGVYHPRKSNSSHRRFLDWMKEYCRVEGLCDGDLERAISDAFYPYEHPVRSRVINVDRGIRRRCGWIRRGIEGVGRLPVRALAGAIVGVKTSEKVVALTFDDGPHPEFTPQLLDLLARHEVAATFFMIGEMANRYPEIVRRVAEAGHAIGNHSWNHPSFPWIDRRERERQVRKCAEAISAYGEPLFRPPYGHQNFRSRQDVERAGYKVVAWGSHVEDWLYQKEESLAARIVENIRPGNILLLHDCIFDVRTAGDARRDYLFAALDRALEEMSGDFEFVTVPELFRRGPLRYKRWRKEGDEGWLSESGTEWAKLYNSRTRKVAMKL